MPKKRKNKSRSDTYYLVVAVKGKTEILCAQNEGTGELYKVDHTTAPMLNHYDKVTDYDSIRIPSNDDIIKLKPKYE